MNTSHWIRSGLVLAVVLAALLVAHPVAAALTVYHWTLDGKPPTLVDDMHLHMQIVKTPFTFAGVLIDDDGRFATSSGSTPASDGTFTVDFAGATVPYMPTDDVHVAFNFGSSDDVKLLHIDWTLGGTFVARTQGQDPALRISTRQSPVSSPPTLALMGIGLVLLGSFAARRATRSGPWTKQEGSI